VNEESLALTLDGVNASPEFASVEVGDGRMILRWPEGHWACSTHFDSEDVARTTIQARPPGTI
jgi:hypothetical protein